MQQHPWRRPCQNMKTVSLWVASKILCMATNWKVTRGLWYHLLLVYSMWCTFMHHTTERTLVVSQVFLSWWGSSRQKSSYLTKQMSTNLHKLLCLASMIQISAEKLFITWRPDSQGNYRRPDLEVISSISYQSHLKSFLSPVCKIISVLFRSLSLQVCQNGHITINVNNLFGGASGNCGMILIGFV